MKVSDIFKVHIAKSHSFGSYKPGDAAFVTNGFFNNGIKGFVKPLKGDRVFNFFGICISAFCEATLQTPPFICRGNGGSGLIVLEPLKKMDNDQLLLYASYLNNYVRWRFSYGRMVTRDRVVNLNLPSLPDQKTNMSVDKYLPPRINHAHKNTEIHYESIPITSLFKLYSGDYHNADEIPDGDIPLVSCGNRNNGIMKFVSVPSEKIYENTLTIAYNGQPLTTKFHPYKFATKDDVAVCIPKQNLRKSTMIFLQFIINSEQWRFSYGRKCFREKLSRIQLKLPVTDERKLDEDGIQNIVGSVTYWDFVNHSFNQGLTLTTDIIE